MNIIESAINIGIMRNLDGAKYLYDLANSEVSLEDQSSVLKDLVTQVAERLLDYDVEEEVLIDARGVQATNVIDASFLWYILESVLLSVDWDSIINYHKETSVTVGS